jgi:hypothetical protein
MVAATNMLSTRLLPTVRCFQSSPLQSKIYRAGYRLNCSQPFSVATATQKDSGTIVVATTLFCLHQAILLRALLGEFGSCVIVSVALSGTIKYTADVSQRPTDHQLTLYVKDDAVPRWLRGPFACGVNQSTRLSLLCDLGKPYFT